MHRTDERSNTESLTVVIQIVHSPILEIAGNTTYDREILKAAREKN